MIGRWNRVPRTKKEVLERFDAGEIQIIEDQYHATSLVVDNG